jgi:hypothetical protein
MNKENLITSLFVVAVVIGSVWWMQQRAAKSAGQNFWEGEREANAKRLFGDAWKDAL